jgi:2-oxoglutarate dehydrogenase complex dehydrogenase (E1) component-like enzyme
MTPRVFSAWRRRLLAWRHDVGGFQPVIADTSEASQVVRLIMCSGKVYYDLRAELEQSL